MRTKVTLILLFLNVALFFFIFHFERSWRTERVAMETRRRVLGAEAAAIRALEIDNAAGAALRVELHPDGWFLTKPLQWRANAEAVNRMISDLQLLNDEASFSVRDVQKNGQTLADYGLDHPALTVTLVSGGPDTTGAPAVTTTLRLGSATQVGDRVYLLSGDGARIHVVGRALLESLERQLDHPALVRADGILTIPVFEARSLNVQTPAGVRFLILRDPRNPSHWSFEYPIPTRANEEAIARAINGLGALRVSRFVPASADIPPPEQLQVTLVGNNRRETLFLGAAVPPEAPPGAPGGSAPAREYYAQLEDLTQRSGRGPLFTVAIGADLLATLNAPEALRDPHVLVDLDPGAVTGIALHSPGQPDLTLQRLDPHGDWQLILPGESQGPHRWADPDAVQHLLNKLAQLTASQFHDAPSAADLENWGFGQPERRVALTLLPPGGPGAASETELEIGRASPRDPVAYAKVTGATSVYVVDPQILQELPVAPLAWRDRLVQSLPPAAVVTRLQLVDLASHQILFDWTPAGESGLAPGPRAAAATVVAQVHDLQVAHFVQAGFPAPADAAAHWRYRLDSTVSLPGGGASDQTSVHSLWIAERTGGADQVAGAPEFDAVFALPQPFVDALWVLTYGGRDPGPPPPARTP